MLSERLQKKVNEVWGMTDDVNFIKKMMKDKLEEDKKKEKGN